MASTAVRSDELLNKLLQWKKKYKPTELLDCAQARIYNTLTNAADGLATLLAADESSQMSRNSRELVLRYFLLPWGVKLLNLSGNAR